MASLNGIGGTGGKPYLGDPISPNQVIAEVELCKGVTAWYDDSNDLVFACDGIKRHKILYRHNRYNIIRAIQYGYLQIVWGSVSIPNMGSITKVNVQAALNKEKKENEAREKAKKEAQLSKDKEENKMAAKIEEVKKEVVEEPKEEPKEEVVEEPKKKTSTRKKKTVKEETPEEK